MAPEEYKAGDCLFATHGDVVFEGDIALDPDHLVKLIRTRLANGSGAGPSGWTGDLIKPLTDDEICLQGLISITLDVSNGVIHGPVKRLLLACRLVGVPKNPGIRPIAVPEEVLESDNDTL